LHEIFVAPLANVLPFTDQFVNVYPDLGVIVAAVNVEPYVQDAGALLIVPCVVSGVQDKVIVFGVHDAFAVPGFCGLPYPVLHDVVQTHWLLTTLTEQFTEFALLALHGAHCSHCAVNVVATPVVIFVISAPNATTSPFDLVHPVKIFVPFVISHIPAFPVDATTSPPVKFAPLVFAFG
jgi:hypothetical protein